MISYLISHPDKIFIPLLEHIQLMLLSMVFSLLLASILTVLAIRSEVFSRLVEAVLSVLYSIPSLAMFALFIPLTGLGRTSTIIVLTLYNQYILVKNFTTGLREVDPYVCEAAEGIGMSAMERLFYIQLPLAKTALFATLRLSIVSTIGIATIASSINAGGLGDLLFDGLRTMNMNKILWGSLLCALLTILLNAVLKLLEKRMAQG